MKAKSAKKPGIVWICRDQSSRKMLRKYTVTYLKPHVFKDNEGVCFDGIDGIDPCSSSILGINLRPGQVQKFKLVPIGRPRMGRVAE